MIALRYRFFAGQDTRQVSLSGAAALPDRWYYEPAEYHGDMLWSFAYETPEAAHAAAERELEAYASQPDADWDDVTEVNL